MPETRFFHIPRKGKVARLGSVSEALQFQKKGEYVWIDMIDPAKEQLNELVEPFGIHPLSVEDCLDDEQIPKTENFEKNTFILFNCYTYTNGELMIDEVDFMLGANYLVTVRGYKAFNPSFFDKLDEAVFRGMSEVNRGPDFLLQLILDYIVDKKFSAIDALQEEVDKTEETILAETADFQPEHLMRLRSCLLTLRKSLFHEREILVKICRRDSPFVSEKAIYYFRDIYDHLAKFFEFIEINRELITSLMELHLSLTNTRMAQISNQTNLVMKRLTAITTVFMPLTLFSGIGGMSEWSMITGPENWLVSYPAFIGLMAILGWFNWWLLRKLQWI
ncbi:MAG TPA: magnesium transporter CorA family protein [Candidatus Ozemobacteraceae bacterium]